mmetsp:Transcript_1655/g.2190  ORF Transcript_1655/g.2190 Transcript_1655/m.2190 type:complete len:604 (+) Transcript_1655:135-1946(+)
MKCKNSQTTKECHPIFSLDDTILGIVFGFSNIIDLFTIRRSNSHFRAAVTEYVRTELHILNFSCLSGIYRKKTASLKASVSKSNKKEWIDYDGNRTNTVIKKEFHEDLIAMFLNDCDSENVVIVDLSNLQIYGRKIMIPSMLLNSQQNNFLSSLITLNLSGCSHLNLSHEDFKTFNSESQNVVTTLEHLYLNGCRCIGPSTIKLFCRKFTNLKTLHLSGCSQTIDDECVKEICTNLPCLTSLDLEGFNRLTDSSVRLIFQKLKKISYLNLNSCQKLDMRFLDTFGRALDNNENLERNNIPIPLILEEKGATPSYSALPLQCLYISSSPRIGIGEGTLAFLACLSAGNLIEVDISGCDFVTDRDIEVLASTCALSLRSLEMVGCKIGDDAILHLETFVSKNLVTLDISACFFLTDVSLTSLSHFKSLKCLKMSSLPRVTGSGVIKLGNIEALLLLDLHNCELVDKPSIQNVVKKCKSLIEIDARDIKNGWAKLNFEEKQRISILNGKRMSDDDDYKIFHMCSARRFSQRLRNGVRPQRMYHCIECNLIPSFRRGICSVCVMNCHKGHRVYFGSVTTFYCDCSFGFQPCGDCRSINIDRNELNIQ